MDAECALKHFYSCWVCAKKYRRVEQPKCLPYNRLSACATPRYVCSTADCATWKCLFYSRLCYLEVSVQQQTVLLGSVCSTADCANWMWLFCSRLFYVQYMDESVLQQTVITGCVCSTAACPALRLWRACSCICCPGRCLAYCSLWYTWTCMSSRVCSAPVHGCLLQEPWSAPVHVCIQELCAAPLIVCLPVLLCCTSSVCVLLDVSVYNSFCDSTECLSTIACVLHLDITGMQIKSKAFKKSFLKLVNRSQ